MRLLAIGKKECLVTSYVNFTFLCTMKTHKKMASDVDQIPKTLAVTSSFSMWLSWAHKVKHANKIHIQRNNIQMQLNHSPSDSEIIIKLHKIV